MKPFRTRTEGLHPGLERRRLGPERLHPGPEALRTDPESRRY
jgi:hypothetical protein